MLEAILASATVPLAMLVPFRLVAPLALKDSVPSTETVRPKPFVVISIAVPSTILVMIFVSPVA